MCPVFGETYNYRWMEKPANPLFEEWLKKQQAFTDSLMQTIPHQDVLASDIKTVFTTIGVVTNNIQSEAGKYAWTQFDARKDKSSKIYFQSGKDGDEKMIFDPIGFRPGTLFQLKDIEFSPLGDWLRISVSKRGEDHETHYFYNTLTGAYASDSIQSMHVSTKFYRINGKDYVFYTGINSENPKDPDYKRNLKLYVHKPGTNEPDMVLLDAEKNPELGIDSTEIMRFLLDDMGDYVLIERTTTSPDVALIVLRKTDFQQGKIAFKNLVKRSDGITDYLVQGNDFYFTQSLQGSREVRVMDLLSADLSKSKAIFKPAIGWEIIGISRSKDFLIISSQKNGLQSRNFRYSFASKKIEELRMPIKGLVSVMPLNISGNEAIVSTRSWTDPPANYSFDIASMKLTKGSFYHTPDFADMDNLVMEEIEVPSHDGVPVPLSISYDKRYVKKDGSNTVLLSDFGAYGSLSSPEFQGFNQFLFKRGIILATAHVRGGGSKGDAWHKAGQKETKPNTWKDAIACAEWLITNKYTSKEKMIIEGRSAGGIMAGMAMMERPDLFKVGNPQVGILNALRYEFTPNGQVNIAEFGSQKTADGFKALYAMDAYQQIKTGTDYPAQFITAGYNDPRVIVWMPAKFAAKMQAENTSNNPVLLQVNFSGGHGSASTLDEQIKLVAQQFAFLLWQTGHPDFQPKK